MQITESLAWKLARELAGKLPPYHGYALDLGGGLVMVHPPKKGYYLIDFPITPEKVEQFEKDNAELIASLPEPNPEKLLAMIRAKHERH